MRSGPTFDGSVFAAEGEGSLASAQPPREEALVCDYAKTSVVVYSYNRLHSRRVRAAKRLVTILYRLHHYPGTSRKIFVHRAVSSRAVVPLVRPCATDVLSKPQRFVQRNRRDVCLFDA